MIAGPNGAGKSTIVRRFNRGRLPVVNPDEIARAIDPARINERSVQLQAGRQALAERTRRIAARESFAVETTMSGHSELAVMREAKELGFKVNLVFVGLVRADLSDNRVALRVRQGGHDVPTADTERRFDRIMANLPLAIRLADRAILLDNSGRRPRLVAVLESGRAPRVVERLPDWGRVALAEANQSPSA